MLLIILAVLCALLAIAGSVLPALPGPMLAYAALLLAQWSGYADFSNPFLWVMAAITAAVFVLDYFLPSLITRKMGGSKYASTGAFIGMVLGIFLTPVGMMLGMLIGAFVGELIFAGESGSHSLKAAFGAFIGFLIGTGVKLALCGYILYAIIVAIIEHAAN